MRLDCISSATFVRLCFPFFYLLRRAFHMRFCLSMDLMHCVQDPLPLWLVKVLLKCVCQWVSCTVHRTHKFLFSTKLLLKIGLTVLFTHLKITLLQCFQILAKKTVSKWTIWKLKITKGNIFNSLEIKNEIHAKLKNKNIILAFILTKWVLL